MRIKDERSKKHARNDTKSCDKLVTDLTVIGDRGVGEKSIRSWTFSSAWREAMSMQRKTMT